MRAMEREREKERDCRLSLQLNCDKLNFDAMFNKVTPCPLKQIMKFMDSVKESKNQIRSIRLLLPFFV